MRDPRPASYRARWESKPVLRAIYTDYYRRMVEACQPGRTLEIGAGSGNLKSFLPDVVSTDLLPAPWLDAVADAQQLPFASGSFSSIVLFDVLHHLSQPVRFFREASRLLRSGGRIVMVEPAITPISWIFYRFFHPEGADMGADPFIAPEPRDGARDPFEGNQAIPSLIFGRFARRFGQEFPELHVLKCERLSLFAYPLSGGFRPTSFLPARAVDPLLRLEDRLLPWLGPLMGFRLLVALERR